MANFIPPEILQEIMRRCDIVDVVSDYVPLKRRGRNHFGLCPFHDEDTPSFSVNQDKQIYKCFGCGKGGNVLSFVQEADSLSFAEAATKLAERCGVTIPEEAPSREQQQRQQQRQALLAMHSRAAEIYAALLPESRQAQAYLSRRGVEAEIARRFGLGVAPEADWQKLSALLLEEGYSEELLIKAGLSSRSAKNSKLYDKFHGRLIFPIRDHRGATVAFGGRAMGDEQPKYLNSQTTPIYNKSQLLYGLDIAGPQIRKSAQAVIMEGYMDVLTAHQFGVDNAVASLGTAFTAEHARLLSRYAPDSPQRLQVLLAFDGDGAGAKAALASLDKLHSLDYVEARVLVFPEQLDPDDFLRKYGMKGWKRLLEKHCYPMLDYLLLRALERHDISNAAGKGQVVAELLPALNKTRSSTERDSFIRELARRLQVDPEAIRADLGRGHDQAQRDGGRRGEQLPQRQRPAPAPAGHPANRQLLCLALSDKNIFTRAAQELGDDFASTQQEAQLIEIIRRHAAEYDFSGASLLNYIDEENEGLRGFLLKLIDTEIPDENRLQVAEDNIRLIKARLVKQALAELQQRIIAAEAAGRDDEAAALAAQKSRLKAQQFKE